MKDISAELAIVSNRSFESSTAVNLHHYDISSALQTSLEFIELINIFANKIQLTIPHNGVEYTNTEFDLHYQRGIVSRHSCTYALKVEEQKLGELKLTRSNRFMKDELKMLESLLCCLIYPLRNATLYQRALKLAYTDQLTKANNRAAFTDCLRREVKRAERLSQPLSLIFIDLDHFKTINDNFGHECGDLVLASVSSWLMDTVRGSDAVFRFGGEEFVIMLCGANLQAAALIAERIRADIEAHTLAYGMEVVNLTASLGISELSICENNAELLVKRADEAMYQAKKLGRNRVCLG